MLDRFGPMRVARAQPFWLDLMIAGAVFAATVMPLLAPSPRVWWVIVLAVLASLPVLWRRRSPIAVALVVGLATTGLAFAQQLPPLPYGALACTYTFAAFSPPVWRLLAVLVQATGVLVSLVVPNEGLIDSGYVGMAFVTAYALGTGTRARHAQIAMLEERARRLEDERTAIVTAERARIARDIHDILTHSLGLIVVQAEAGPLARDDADLVESTFDTIGRIGRDAITQLRPLFGALRTAGDHGGREPLPGIDALKGLVERTRQAGLDIEIECEGDPRRVTADVDVAAYRLVQESLTNVLKHSSSRRVGIRMCWQPDALELSVVDDGRPLKTSVKGTAGTGGHGVVGMRERVALCGGSFRIGPLTGGHGFMVAATFPIR